MKIPDFQINIVTILTFLKKLKDEKFKIGFILRGTPDVTVTIPKPRTGCERSIIKNR